MREIVLDTETTGLEPTLGHRIIEIGCVELENHVPTGVTFQRYINPGRAIDAEATVISGITNEMLSGAPTFAGVADALLEFLGDAPLVIHNAPFDLGFLNAEFALIARPGFPLERAIDTLRIARRKFPGAPASLDALCKRFAIDASERVKHGALLDARLLAEVYLELIGGRQTRLDLSGARAAAQDESGVAHETQTARTVALPSLLTESERAAHDAFLNALKGEVLWRS